MISDKDCEKVTKCLRNFRSGDPISDDELLTSIEILEDILYIFNNVRYSLFSNEIRRVLYGLESMKFARHL